MINKLGIQLGLCLVCVNAHASLEICNETLKPANASIMIRDEAEKAWISTGWYVVPPSQCITLIASDLKERSYYFYVRREDGKKWNGSGRPGQVSGCIADDQFRIDDAKQTCDEAGGTKVKFGRFHRAIGDFRNQSVTLISSEESKLAQGSTQPGREPSLLTESERKTLSAADQYALQAMREAAGNVAAPASTRPPPLRSAQSSNSVSSTVSSGFTSAAEIEKACQVIHAQLDRPKLRSEKITIAHYTDILTPPQTKSECTNIKDTGVPDPATCVTEMDPCGEEWHGPFGTWGCIPTTATRCTNIKVCDTYVHSKKTMECDLQVQLKLPNFIEKPISAFVDESYEMIESTRRQVAASLPLACAPKDAQAAGDDPTKAIANQISTVIQRRIRVAIEKEARQWVVETGVKTIVAAIPSGGIGGAAAMSTSLADFIYRAHRVIKPIIKIGNEVKDTAEDLGFSTSCGWNDWHQW